MARFAPDAKSGGRENRPSRAFAIEAKQQLNQAGGNHIPLVEGGNRCETANRAKSATFPLASDYDNLSLCANARCSQHLTVLAVGYGHFSLGACFCGDFGGDRKVSAVGSDTMFPASAVLSDFAARFVVLLDFLGWRRYSLVHQTQIYPLESYVGHPLLD